MLCFSKCENADDYQAQDEIDYSTAEQADDAADSSECHTGNKKTVFGFLAGSIHLNEPWCDLVSILTFEIPVLSKLFVSIL